MAFTAPQPNSAKIAFQGAPAAVIAPPGAPSPPGAIPGNAAPAQAPPVPIPGQDNPPPVIIAVNVKRKAAELGKRGLISDRQKAKKGLGGELPPMASD